MTIDLYTIQDDPKKLIKTLTAVSTGITCKPGEPCSILTPRLMVSYNAAYIGANYMYVPAWGRYYFLNPPTLITGSRLELSGSVDPLMSWAQSLLNIECTVVRSESAGINYMQDNKLPVDPSQSFVQGILFENAPFEPIHESDTWFVLTVNGGA